MSEWTRSDFEAIELLKGAGYREVAGVWYLPSQEHSSTEDELSAVTYLCDEWDYCYDFRPGARP